MWSSRQALASSETVLPASPAVTKTKRSLGRESPIKQTDKSQTLKQRIQVILLVFKLQYIQIYWGGGIADIFKQKAIENKTKQNKTIKEASHHPVDQWEVPLH